MKKIVAFLILSCLVFLNVPRGLVHDCDHDSEEHHETSHNSSEKHDESSHHDSGDHLSFEVDDCFSCEFQLDVASSPLSLSLKLADQEYSRFIETKLNRYSSREFTLFSLRGPPIV